MVDDVLQQWIRVIDDDLGAVRACLSVKDPPVLPAAYHCQQAAEKIVKFLIAVRGDHPPKIHDIAALTKLLGEHPLADAVRSFSRFTVYGAAYRYPGAGFLESEADEPTAEDVASWLAEIEAVRAEIDRFLAP
ncbi:MAG TPA: HEPN domain-containing protein [Azospirillum sp.]|nr:HEPN domain-containing protein [Azospirillum sp.]